MIRTILAAPFVIVGTLIGLGGLGLGGALLKIAERIEGRAP